MLRYTSPQGWERDPGNELRYSSHSFLLQGSLLLLLLSRPRKTTPEKQPQKNKTIGSLPRMSQEHRYSSHTYGFARRSATVGSPVLLHASSFRMDSNTDPVYSNTSNALIYHYKHLKGHLKDLILDYTPKVSDQLPSALLMDNVQNERHKSKVSSSSQWELSIFFWKSLLVLHRTVGLI